MPLKQNHPDHVAGYVSQSEQTFGREADGFHYFWRVQCGCGAQEFFVRRGDKQTIRAVCAVCRNEISLYDLDEYPAAGKASGEEMFSLVNPGTPRRLVVMYEYGDLDADQSFDPNDITWCCIWIEGQNGEGVLILDDETA